MPKSKKSKSKKSKTNSNTSDKLDVRSLADIPLFEKLLKEKRMIILVHADWCGHCQTFKEKVWKNVPNSSTNTFNMASIHHDMLEKTSLANAKIEGYPTLMMSGTDGKLADIKNERGEMTNAIRQPATAAELQKMVTVPNPISANSNNTSNNTSSNTNNNTSNNNSLKTSSNILSMNNSNSNTNSSNNSS
jgi:thiol:disulfide interchange protein